ncbi:MAG: YcxB family protein [Flavobacteriales bacterium]
MSSLYPYTMQPIPYELSVAEQHEAQLSLWRAGNHIPQKTWIIVALVALAGVAGIYWFQGYSTIFFWLLVIGAALYMAVRIFAIEWYVKRQIAKQELQPLGGIKIGVQPQGLVMVQKIPANAKAPKGMALPPAGQEARGVIGWKEFTEWRETEQYLYLFYQVKGQQGTQIIPKRMTAQKLPIDTIRKHLLEIVGAAKTD